MSVTFGEAVGRLDEEAFYALYGSWKAMAPERVAELLSAAGVGWWIAGGRAARVGAAPRRHEDTDVVIRVRDLDAARQAMRGWHLWQNIGGALCPLLPGVPLAEDCVQLWVRREARQPWRLDFLIDRGSTDEEWVFKRDASVRLPWDQATHTVDGVGCLRPEVALLFKAKLDRPKDRADLLAAGLAPARRTWLAGTLEKLGYHEWAELAREHAGRT